MKMDLDTLFLSASGQVTTTFPSVIPSRLPAFFAADREKVILVIDGNRKFLNTIAQKLVLPGHGYRPAQVSIDSNSRTLVKNGTTVMLTPSYDAAENVVEHNANLDVLILGSTLKDPFRRTTTELAKIGMKRRNIQAIYSFSADPLLSVRLAEANFLAQSGRGGSVLRAPNEVVHTISKSEGENLASRPTWEKREGQNMANSLSLS